MAKVLVTGGAGFIGSHLCEVLLTRGDSVAAVDNLDDFYSPALKRANLELLQSHNEFRHYHTNILDREALRRVLQCERPSVVVHLAARAGVRPSLREPHRYLQTNVTGTLNVLEAAVDCHVSRFIFASSSSGYGGVREIPFREDGPVAPISPYAATKVAGEALCHAYARLHGLSTICLRFFSVYGPRQRPDMAIHKFTELIAARRPLPILGDGSSSRDYTFIGDIIRGIQAALYLERDFEVINLGNSQPVRLAELVSALSEALDIRPSCQQLPPAAGEPDVTCADISKAAALLGWRPTVSLADGLKSFVEWWLTEHPLTRSSDVGLKSMAAL